VIAAATQSCCFVIAIACASKRSAGQQISGAFVQIQFAAEKERAVKKNSNRKNVNPPAPPPIERGGLHRWIEPVALFTLFLFLATSWLVWETRKLVHGEEESSQRQLRAYLAPEPVNFGIFGDRVTIKLKLKNVGSTPANRVASTSTIAVLPRPLPADYVFAHGSLDHSPFILYPGQERETITVHNVKLSPEELSRLGNGEALYFYGEIGYVDAFNKPQRTTYCIFVDGKVVVETYARRDQPELTVPGSWLYAERFNEGT